MILLHDLIIPQVIISFGVIIRPRFQDAVIIIDDAHLIPECCLSAGSLKISAKQISMIGSELRSIAEKAQDCEEPVEEYSHIMLLRKVVCCISEWITTSAVAQVT